MRKVVIMGGLVFGALALGGCLQPGDGAITGAIAIGPSAGAAACSAITKNAAQNGLCVDAVGLAVGVGQAYQAGALK